jgi:formylglycine-generating enzyme required for sulfatase activity
MRTGPIAARDLLSIAVGLGLLQLTSAFAKDLAPGSEFRDCDRCPLMMVIPSGTFVMGSPHSESGYTDEKPQHEVTIAKNIAISKFEATFDQWDACSAAGRCAAADDDGFGRADYPVINVSWTDAKAYVAWLSELTGVRYRLLSEAEFEYAARAGTTTRWFWGTAETSSGSPDACLFANLHDEASKEVHPNYVWSHHKCNDGYAENAPTGKYKPNEFGLHDMTGNVREWVEDCYQMGYEGAPTDGSVRAHSPSCEKVFEGMCMDKFDTAPTDGSVQAHGEACEKRVVRGAAWRDNGSMARSAFRFSEAEDFRNYQVGFRVARDLE